MAGSPADDLTFLQAFANLLGAPEPALRLLISILIGYPIVLIHRYTLYCRSPILQHLYFIATGISIALFNYGHNVIHSALCVLAAWLLLLVMGGTLKSVIISFLFQMTYLLVGYYMTGTDTYDIKWSMPHCVLTLRLIALTYDVYDGTKDPAKLSNDQQKTALSIRPSLLEVAAHTYFPASFMVGPQFAMRRYLDFVNGTLVGSERPPCLLPGVLRGGLGLIYLAVYQIGISYLPDAFINSAEYDDLTFWKRHIVVGVWAKITLYKYISCWLIAEGVCIMSGLSYSGKDANGNCLWNGCANVKIRLYEGATSFGDMISSFNINTNAWVAQYVYKRLRFLNNRYISQFAALVFLAVWHGLHSGYYACFFMEFVVINFEKDLASTVNQYPRLLSVLNAGPLKYIKFVILKLYVVVFMGYCLGPFVLLKLHRWWNFYTSLYFSGHIFFAGWPLYAAAVKSVIKAIGGERVRVEKGKKE
ncbi:lysophospholipid acyltransferase 5-like isoform X2 [Penaeus japonicus]|uniref:lysophospholipid acyltransferase 5-like isoform X2 n=1 Tax=Penaeus japonicus TaxID=27405 RepID=UPI001C711E09|nr:lysophospholipid acyltransferase 5-like isoform X2 [Penaeus japonicus]